MAENSAIEWCDHTFNPWWGCTKVSPACDHCYADALDRRAGGAHWGAHAPRRRTKDWSGPMKWNRRCEKLGIRERVFCASMADVFDNHRSILPDWRANLWSLIAATPHLDWLLLTKRPQNIAKMLPATWGKGWPNVWLGTTVENQTEANRRIPHLLDTPARVRFLSCEPLLGPVDLDMILTPEMGIYALSGIRSDGSGPSGFSQGPRIDWVICGGESGPGARPMHPDWALSLRDQCQELRRTPFFFKQWGEWFPGEIDDKSDGHGMCAWPDDNHDPKACMWEGRWKYTEVADQGFLRVGKKNAGRLLDGREWNDVPITKGPCGE
jgi:protein gp37